MLHRESYLQYLRDLYVVYSALEQQLSFHNRNPKLSALFLPALFRSAALRRDLICLAGPDFERRISHPCGNQVRACARSVCPIPSPTCLHMRTPATL